MDKKAATRVAAFLL